MGVSTPLVITLEYWAWLMHIAMAWRSVLLLNGVVEVFNMMHCTVGWPDVYKRQTFVRQHPKNYHMAMPMGLTDITIIKSKVLS